ncbi:Pollen receptor-like kinase 3 [Salvia divinorum]|uniref:Pollen receptor-like kinase 3 n=1 Tax=Salvia divinorum TaxID=28513 RepID=A0ABD1FM46_SALDI
MTTATATTTAAVRPLIISLLILSLQTTSLSLPGEGDNLIQFKTSLEDSSSLDPTWVAGTDPCDRTRPWLGVHCSDTTVSSLLLMNLGLYNNEETGIDVAPLEKLENLRFLSLENNSFTGPMPQFNQLSSLKSLFLSGNRLSGEIPSSFFTPMGSLKKLELFKNNFTGKIPHSLQQLDSLIEIMLQMNQFSGPFPVFDQKSLKVLDLSFNNLEGEIPHSMQRRFPASTFEGNPDACGVVINKPCKAVSNTLPPIGEAIMASNSTTKWVVLAIVVAVLLVTILFKKKEKSDMFSMIGSDPSIDNHHEHAVEVHAPSINRRAVGSVRRGGNYNENGSLVGKKGQLNSGKSSDLVMINEEKGVFGLSDLMKAAAEVLGNSGLGSSYKATMANYGMPVVAKRMRGMNKLNKDAFDVEIRRLGRIRHRNILPPLAYHYRKEEKLLVTEFVPKGSLMFVLHGDGGIAHAELDWPTRLKIIKGVGRGMGFLHTELSELELPHGNLKSSNILLSANHEPLLTDYSLHSLSSTAQSLQGYKSPEVVLHQQITPKSDVYCLGVVILEVMTGKYPSQYHNNGTDLVSWAKEAVANGKVAELIDPEIVNGGGTVAEMERMLCIGAACAEDDHVSRMEMREAIRSIEGVQV